KLFLAFFSGKRKGPGGVSGSKFRKIEITPPFREVHVDKALRRPHPIVLRQKFSCVILHFYIIAIHYFHVPLDARKVDSPQGSFFRNSGVVSHGNRAKRDGHFYCPTFIFILRIIYSSFDLYSRPKSGRVPMQHGLSAYPIRFGKK